MDLEIGEGKVLKLLHFGLLFLVALHFLNESVDVFDSIVNLLEFLLLFRLVLLQALVLGLELLQLVFVFLLYSLLGREHLVLLQFIVLNDLFSEVDFVLQLDDLVLQQKVLGLLDLGEVLQFEHLFLQLFLLFRL